MATCLNLNKDVSGPPGQHSHGKCRVASGVAAGILLSINETHPKDSLITPLKLHTHRGDWDRKPVQYSRLQRLGVKTMQLLLSDM